MTHNISDDPMKPVFRRPTSKEQAHWQQDRPRKHGGLMVEMNRCFIRNLVFKTHAIEIRALQRRHYCSSNEHIPDP